ncbi:MAG: hypothetical protein ABIO86_01025 [Sphingomonas sp.]
MAVVAVAINLSHRFAAQFKRNRAARTFGFHYLYLQVALYLSSSFAAETQTLRLPRPQQIQALHCGFSANANASGQRRNRLGGRLLPKIVEALFLGELGVLAPLQFVLDRFPDEHGQPPVADARFNAADRINR